MRVLVKKVNEFLEKVGRDHVGAYAAQSAFFLVLSLIAIYAGNKSGCDDGGL